MTWLLSPRTDTVQMCASDQELRSNLIAAYEYNGEFEKAREQMEAYTKDYPKDASAAKEYLFLICNKDEETDKE